MRDNIKIHQECSTTPASAPATDYDSLQVFDSKNEQFAVDGNRSGIVEQPPNYGTDYPTVYRKTCPQLAQQCRVAPVSFMLEGVPPERFQAGNLHLITAAQAQYCEMSSVS